MYTPVHFIRKVLGVLSADGESKECAPKPGLAASQFFAGFAFFHHACVETVSLGFASLSAKARTYEASLIYASVHFLDHSCPQGNLYLKLGLAKRQRGREHARKRRTCYRKP
jgi:hypothetical protein